jgi:hypothetical protein
VKNRSETKIKQKKVKKAKKSKKKAKKSEKSEKNEKIYLNFASLCFAPKQKLLNRSEAKYLKRKKRKKCQKMRKIAKKSEKKQKKQKKTLISLRFVWLRSENYSSEAKRKILSEKKQKKRSEIL